ncbi:MAG: radical SAM protein [Candidatus Omnitrophica bacterium]|nr:radical SAM protein [Candidatus Omnitrophota bacterium]
MAIALRRVWNPPNPYLTQERELLGQPPTAELEVYEDDSDSILSHNESPDIGFRWSINPYRGCFHACAYCVSGDTPIALANGRTKTIANIRVGDEIYGTVLCGRYRRFVKTPVLAHWSVVKPAYRITLEDGTQLIASADHRFLTNRGWKHVTGIQHGQTRRPHLTIGNELLGTGQFTAPPEEDAEYQKGYLCGLIRGDGLLASYNYDGRRRANDTQHQFRLALIDLEALHRARRYLLTFEVPTHEILFQRTVEKHQEMRAIRTNARSHFERVCEIVRWPAAADINWCKGFLAGIFDAEGSYSRGIFRIHNTNPDIIACITDSFRRFRFDYAVEKRPGTNRPVYVVRLRDGLTEHLRFFQTTGPAIARKKDIAGQAIKNNARLRVVSIEKLGVSKRMFDITTGTGDFIANGAVSHNCYARPTHEYLGLGAGTDFERKIFVKKNAPRLLEQAFRRPSWRGERIVFSGVTDCYQPLEASWRLTRGCLEVCSRFRNPAGIITKSLLIRRDIDVLRELHLGASVSVSISIPFADDQTARKIEPGAPAIHRRFETMQLLADAGIPVGIGIAPVIPGLNEKDIPTLLKRAKEHGARFAFHTLLRLPGSVKQVFFHRMQEEFPDRMEKIEHAVRASRRGKLYDSRFGMRHAGFGQQWETVEKLWEVWTNKLGFNQEEDEEEEKPTFRRPPPGGQMELF